ncbi:MAG: glycosyltransferase [Paludibacteraceae bacterium]|nr:glycosyltransferase [Paludibacteraceae bacterium]
MRVLQLPSWYVPEGGMFCTEQSIALQEQGVEVHILANVMLPWRKYKRSIFSYPWNPFFTNEHGIPIVRYYGWRIPFADLLNMHLWVKHTLRLFALYLKTYGKPDIIHVHSSMWGGYAASLIKKKYDVPYIITEHRGRFSENSSDTETLLPASYTPYLQEAFTHANAIVAVSKQLTNRIRTYAGNAVPISNISNVVDTNFFTPKKTQQTADSFTFINANSFHFAKGYDVLLASFEQVYKIYPKVRLVLLGTGFDDREFTLQLNQLSSKNRIEFKGYQTPEGVRHYLQKSDSFVLSSRIEAQPIAILEAMSCGLPIVCTQVVPAEIVTPTVGIHCASNDIHALAKAMIQMVETREKFDTDAIRKQAIEVCSRKAVASKLIAIYQQHIAHD